MNDRKPPVLLTILMPTFALMFGLAGLLMGWQIWGRQDRGGDLGKIRSALDRINNRYYPGVSNAAVLDGVGGK